MGNETSSLIGAGILVNAVIPHNHPSTTVVIQNTTYERSPAHSPKTPSPPALKRGAVIHHVAAEPQYRRRGMDKFEIQCRVCDRRRIAYGFVSPSKCPTCNSANIYNTHYEQQPPTYEQSTA